MRTRALIWEAGGERNEQQCCLSLWGLSEDPIQRFPSCLQGSVSTAAQKGAPYSVPSVSGHWVPRGEWRSLEGCIGAGPLHPFLGRGSGPGEELSLRAAGLVPHSLGWTLHGAPGPCHGPPTPWPASARSPTFTCTQAPSHWASQHSAVVLGEGRRREAMSWLGPHSWQGKDCDSQLELWSPIPGHGGFSLWTQCLSLSLPRKRPS